MIPANRHFSGFGLAGSRPAVEFLLVPSQAVIRRCASRVGGRNVKRPRDGSPEGAVLSLGAGGTGIKEVRSSSSMPAVGLRNKGESRMSANSGTVPGAQGVFGGARS